MTRLFPPVDSAESVEIAPGVFVPANRFEEVMSFIHCNSEVNEAIAEIIMERECTDPLTDDICTAVPFQFLSELEWGLAEKLVKQSNRHFLQAKTVRSFALPGGL